MTNPRCCVDDAGSSSKRRFRLKYSEAQLAPVFKNIGTKELRELMDGWRKTPRPVQPLLQIQAVGSMDEWKRGLNK
jgi:hypothetical protein